MRRPLSILALLGLLTVAVGATAAAAETPAKIQVLLITGDDVAVHPWREIADATRDALPAGKFDVKVSEDLSPLESASELARYDVIVLTRFNRAAPLGEQGKANLLAFVKGGKGFFVQHLASASFPKWPEFGKLCGRYWVMGKSGHGPRSTFESKIVDPEHPITRGMKPFQTDDELYAKLQGAGPIRVLVQADSPWSKKTEPLVFTLDYGKGRVVHNAFGHDRKAILTPPVAKLIARGAEWAATGQVADAK
jgi:type 1 glutamine amidotransferase